MAIAQIIQNKLTTTAALLYMAFELSNSRWKNRFSDGVKFRNRTIEAGDLVSLGDEIQNAIEKFKLAEDVEIHSCYEEGRDGFWLHRYLEDLGIDNLVVDSSSIQVDRRARKAKTDRLDVEKLMVMLIRHIGGEQKVLDGRSGADARAGGSAPNEQGKRTAAEGKDAAYQQAQVPAGHLRRHNEKDRTRISRRN